MFSGTKDLPNAVAISFVSEWWQVEMSHCLESLPSAVLDRLRVVLVFEASCDDRHRSCKNGFCGEMHRLRVHSFGNHHQARVDPLLPQPVTDFYLELDTK